MADPRQPCQRHHGYLYAVVSQCSSVESGYSCGESSFGFGPRQPYQHHRGYLYAVVSQRIVVVSQCSSGESVYSCGESSFG